MNMTEKVARAIYTDTRTRIPHYREWDDLNKLSQGIYLSLAKAAIKAMREPSEEMIEAGTKEIIAEEYTAARSKRTKLKIASSVFYYNMIDAALEE